MMAKFLIATLVLLTLMGPTTAKAGDGKLFFTTVVYGTVAGTLVGIATLAFSSSPGDNVMNIARGASLGLYVGIALGAYLYYQDGNDTPNGIINPDGLPPQEGQPQGLLYKSKQLPFYGFSLFPLVQNGNVGVGANLISLKF